MIREEAASTCGTAMLADASGDQTEAGNSRDPVQGCWTLVEGVGERTNYSKAMAEVADGEQPGIVGLLTARELDSSSMSKNCRNCREGVGQVQCPEQRRKSTRTGGRGGARPSL